MKIYFGTSGKGSAGVIYPFLQRRNIIRFDFFLLKGKEKDFKIPSENSFSSNALININILVDSFKIFISSKEWDPLLLFLL